MNPLPALPTADIQFDAQVDARGLSCPLPILRAKKALAQLDSTQILCVYTSDAASITDFQAFTRQTGHQLLAQIPAPDEAGVCVHWLKKR